MSRRECGHHAALMIDAVSASSNCFPSRVMVVLTLKFEGCKSGRGRQSKDFLEEGMTAASSQLKEGTRVKDSVRIR